jgi:cytochrome P450
MRKVVAPCFTPSQMRYLVPAFWEKAKELNWRVRQIIDKSGEKEATINMMAWLDRVTFDMIGATAFGAEFEGLRDPDQGFFAIFNRNYPQDGFTNPLDAFYNYVLPIFVPHSILNRLPISAYQNAIKDMKLIKQYCQSFIQKELEKKDFEDVHGNHKSMSLEHALNIKANLVE